MWNSRMRRQARRDYLRVFSPRGGITAEMPASALPSFRNRWQPCPCGRPAAHDLVLDRAMLITLIEALDELLADCRAGACISPNLAA